MILSAFSVILKLWPNNYCGLLDLCAEGEGVKNCEDVIHGSPPNAATIATCLLTASRRRLRLIGHETNATRAA